MKKVLICALLAGVWIAALPPQRGSALPIVSLRQNITQISCVLTTVVRDDGSLRYVIVPGCGALVVPELYAKQPQLITHQLSQFAVPTQGEAAKLFLRTKPIYLDTSAENQPAGGYVLLVYKDIKYAFLLPGERFRLHDRTFEIISIKNGTLNIRFLPEGKETAVKLGETIRLQLAYDGTPDVSLTFIQQNIDGSVLVRVRFPVQQEVMQLVEEQRTADIATMLLLVFGGSLLVLFLQSKTLARRGIPSATWWNTHTHQPLG
ncbi:hypothetical protein IPL85_03130 [Candidatus Saccharibacteria bacterium]|nr:MAG: hypothetical protein IPL85_03130 [Candidatus Saccharibacteria bacterium]